MHILKVRRKKWDLKSEQGIFVEYVAGSKVYCDYSMRSSSVVERRQQRTVSFGTKNSAVSRMASADISPDSEQNAATTVAESLPANETGAEELPDRLKPALPPQQEAPYCVVWPRVWRSGREPRTSSVPSLKAVSLLRYFTMNRNGSSSGGRRRTVQSSGTKHDL